MQNNIFLKLKNSNNILTALPAHTRQAGVSLIITFFVMIIILAVILSVTTLLYQEIKMIRNIGNSVVAFYAADTGVEKVLYYDRKVIPTGATRGLCSMFAYSAENLSACPKSSDVSSLDSGLYCNQIIDPNTSLVTDFLKLTDVTNYPNGCDADKCNACTLSFTTTFSPDNSLNNERSYTTVATISPVEGSSNLTIDSAGVFRSLNRKVELYMAKPEATDFIRVLDAYATPTSSAFGTKILVGVKLTSVNGVANVKAYIKTSRDEDRDDVPAPRIIPNLTLSGGYYTGDWTGELGAYFVDVVITDGANPPNTLSYKIYPF